MTQISKEVVFSFLNSFYIKQNRMPKLKELHDYLKNEYNSSISNNRAVLWRKEFIEENNANEIKYRKASYPLKEEQLTIPPIQKVSGIEVLTYELEKLKERQEENKEIILAKRRENETLEAQIRQKEVLIGYEKEITTLREQVSQLEEEKKRLTILGMSTIVNEKDDSNTILTREKIAEIQKELTEEAEEECRVWEHFSQIRSQEKEDFEQEYEFLMEGKKTPTKEYVLKEEYDKLKEEISLMEGGIVSEEAFSELEEENETLRIQLEEKNENEIVEMVEIAAKLQEEKDKLEEEYTLLKNKYVAYRDDYAVTKRHNEVLMKQAEMDENTVNEIGQLYSLREFVFEKCHKMEEDFKNGKKKPDSQRMKPLTSFIKELCEILEKPITAVPEKE